MKVREIMTSPVVTVSPGTPFKEVLVTLVEAGVSGVPVVDDEGRLVGIVTEADLIPKEACPGRRRALAALADVLSGHGNRWLRKARGTSASDVMTTDVLACGPDDDLRAVAREMGARRVKRMPVVDEGVLVGIVSRHDVLAAFDRPDEGVAADVERTLASDPNRPDDMHVEVRVHEGVVTLRGDVRYPWDEAIVVSLVRGVLGVLDVVSELHAREHEPPSTGGPWVLAPR